jgi:hypothetical protein
MNAAGQNLMLATRQLWRYPRITVTVMITLELFAATNTAIASRLRDRFPVECTGLEE